MKKLLITMAITLMGVIANAASVTWSINAIQSSPDVNVGEGWLVQVYSSSVVYSYDAAKTDSISVWSSANTVAAGATFRATATVENGVAASTTESFYAVIYNASSVAGATHYIVSANLDVSVAENDKPVSPTFGSMLATSVANNKFYGKEWQSVPEPTSGLLLLIGMGALALRRKQK